MATRFDDHECPPQVVLGMLFQDRCQLSVDGLQRPWSNPQIDDSSFNSAAEDQPTEVPIASYQYSARVVSEPQQNNVGGGLETAFRNLERVVARIAKEERGGGVDVVVDQESHAVAVTWISSLSASSMAKRIQAWMSSTERSG